MHAIRFHLALLAVLSGCCIAPARAAESYDNCTGFIDTLPTTITTQGVWCLRDHLSTAITTGNAITIATNNVTIDCNNFKIGGLQAGDATLATGIYASQQLNATVRHCSIRGFYRGIFLEGGGGHVVEDNLLEGITKFAIVVDGDGSLVQRNQVRDTGVVRDSPKAITVTYSVDVLDNTVDGVLSATNPGGGGSATGIDILFGAGSIRGNRVRGLVKQGTGVATGIKVISNSRAHLRDNDLTGDGSTGVGLSCGGSNGTAKDNIISGFATGISGCSNSGGNVVKL